MTRNVSKEHVIEIFSTYGVIRHVDMPFDVVHSAFNKGFAYIEYEKPEEADQACKYMDGGQIDGQEVKVNISQPPAKPRLDRDRERERERERDRQRERDRNRGGRNNASPSRRGGDGGGRRSPPRRGYSPDRRGGAGAGANSRRSRSPVNRRSPRPNRSRRNRSSSSSSSNSSSSSGSSR